jgi:hypothetical protein
VDRKINEIDKKIRESEFEKKRLGVEFVPFEKKLSLRKSHKN